jgi:sulfur transfer protein SufE
MKRKDAMGSQKEATTKKLMALVEDFLSQFPAEERTRRIRNFGKAISAVKKKKNAKAARPPRVSSGPRRAAARG